MKSTSPSRRLDCVDHHEHYSVDRAKNFDYFDIDDDTNDDNYIDYDVDNYYDDFHLKSKKVFDVWDKNYIWIKMTFDL